jgi:hypothetical protein
MKYIVTTIDITSIENNPFILISIPILSGKYINKFAYDLSSLETFLDVFKNLTYEVVDLDASAFEIDTTPPLLSPYAVVIPEIYQWAFPEDKFVLSGFEIPLDTHNNDKVVNLAYFMWTEFRAELDSGNYEALKRALMPLWDYVELQVINNNLVIL